MSGVNDVDVIKASGAKESLVAELIDRTPNGQGVALPGDTEAGTNQTDLVVATYLINEMVGDLVENLQQLCMVKIWLMISLLPKMFFKY